MHFLGKMRQPEGGWFIHVQPAELNYLQVSYEASHNSRVLECRITAAWSCPNHPHAEDGMSFYSTLAIAEFTASISAPKSLPSVPLFL